MIETAPRLRIEFAHPIAGPGVIGAIRVKGYAVAVLDFVALKKWRIANEKFNPAWHRVRVDADRINAL